MQSFQPVQLTTDRLTLRPITEADTEAMYAIFSDPIVMRYWSTPPWENLEQSRESIARDIEALHTGDYLRLGIVQKDTNQLVGACTLFNFNWQCKRAEVGYALARSAWGRRFMGEALAAFIEYAFTELALHRIEAEIDPRNTASAKTLERLGFLKEGHLRERWIVNDEISDSDLYGLLGSDRGFQCWL
ncbi:GNAT family N-acetyltransferase [filamentous cyanobacterium CCP1]|nr:GNAT family N-acetyltransferase [filamentous cyanobacterium CCP2]PSB66870.1 GNAT family N-acetyltransferase [filamentous cyanobacterium CCP1]